MRMGETVEMAKVVLVTSMYEIVVGMENEVGIDVEEEVEDVVFEGSLVVEVDVEVCFIDVELEVWVDVDERLVEVVLGCGWEKLLTQEII